MYAPWAKNGYVNVQSHMFYWKSKQRKFIEVRRGMMYSFEDDSRNKSTHCIQLADTDVQTSTQDPSLPPFALQLVKTDESSELAHLQITLGDSVQQAVGAKLLLIECESEHDYQTWLHALSTHITYAKSPYRRWMNYYIVDRLQSLFSCCCSRSTTSNDPAQQELVSRSTTGKVWGLNEVDIYILDRISCLRWLGGGVYVCMF